LLGESEVWHDAEEDWYDCWDGDDGSLDLDYLEDHEVIVLEKTLEVFPSIPEEANLSDEDCDEDFEAAVGAEIAARVTPAVRGVAKAILEKRNAFLRTIGRRRPPTQSHRPPGAPKYSILEIVAPKGRWAVDWLEVDQLGNTLRNMYPGGDPEQVIPPWV